MTKPNLIFILCDDLGYGDLQCYQPEGKIPTPHLDELAAGGVRFTDAHASTAVCTPSRYNVLTGRYCWRSRLKQGIVWEWDAPLLEEGRTTVADLLKANGYRTHCVGKWHLGWDWACLDGSRAHEHVEFGVQTTRGPSRMELGFQIDYHARIGGGPVDRGFDTYFGVDVPNFAPYTWFENDRLAEVPTAPKAPDLYGHDGFALPGWRHEEMLPRFVDEAKKVIEADHEEPFFLYMPLTSPHSPVTPNEEFQGRSGAGNYGDFVCETDWVVGQVMESLKVAGKLDNTLVIFTSDNGPEWRTPDDIGVYERFVEYGHSSVGELRGIKRDTWEGGHRVPYIAHWPEKIQSGSTCNELVTLGDLMATCADICGVELGPDEGEDSVSFLPLLEGKEGPVRTMSIFHGMRGTFALRQGDWVFIDAPTGADFPDRELPEWNENRGYTDAATPGLLYNLTTDLGERENLYDQYPEKVAEFQSILEEHKALASSRKAFSLSDEGLTE